jgi:[acyl-carrier-protein] S-malonyltransferase
MTPLCVKWIEGNETHKPPTALEGSPLPYWGWASNTQARDLFTLHANGSTCVQDVKAQIEVEKGIAVANQRIFLFGKELEDARILSSYGIDNIHDPLVHLMTNGYIEPAAKAKGQYNATAIKPQDVVKVSAESQGQRMPVALLFPGQGSQYVGMLQSVQDLPEVKEMLSKAKEILGYDILKLCLEGPEEKLGETRYCQPALFIGGLAGVAKLRNAQSEAAERPQCVAGLSLGEYTALCVAGVLTFEDGLRLVKLRGEAMQEAAEASKQAMISVAGLDKPTLEKACEEARKKEGSGAVCQVANQLFPKGFACAGTLKAVLALEEIAKEKGALQAKLLKTSGAFHTPLMKPAQVKLENALNDVFPNMCPPRCAVYMNVTGEPIPAGTNPKVILDLLSRQLVSSVMWEPTIKSMIKDGVTEFYECGPMKQLKAMMKRIDQKVWTKTEGMEV